MRTRDGDGWSSRRARWPRQRRRPRRLRTRGTSRGLEFRIEHAGPRLADLAFAIEADGDIRKLEARGLRCGAVNEHDVRHLLPLIFRPQSALDRVLFRELHAHRGIIIEALNEVHGALVGRLDARELLRFAGAENLSGDEVGAHLGLAIDEEDRAE